MWRVARVAWRTLRRRRAAALRRVPLQWTDQSSDPVDPDVVAVQPHLLHGAARSLGLTEPPADGVRVQTVRGVVRLTRDSRVYRLTWTAATPQSLILKRVVRRDPGAGFPREVAVYRSGILGQLPPPLYAPRCGNSVAGERGAYELWLEDLHPGTRPLGRAPDELQRVAQALGRLDASAWVADPPPCDLRNLVAARAVAWLSDPGGIAALVPGSALRVRLELLLRDAPLLLDACARLTPVLCHQDATRLNVRIPIAPQDRRIALLDWDVFGWAPLGQELVPLVWPRCEDAPRHRLEADEAWAWRGYLDGVESVRGGLSPGGRQEIRLAYTAALALRYGVQVAKAGHPAVLDLVLRRGEEALGMVRA